MAALDAAVIAAVRRKLHITWEDETAWMRIEDVIDTVSPRLASLLALPEDHAFSKGDGAAWSLFLNGCLYEDSDAWDDFEAHYEREIQSVRLHNLAEVADAQAQG